MQSLADQLLAAMKGRRWSVRRLLDASKLDCDRSSLHRKLHGKQPMSHEEIQALVNALGSPVALAVVPIKGRRAS